MKSKLKGRAHNVFQVFFENVANMKTWPKIDVFLQITFFVPPAT